MKFYTYCLTLLLLINIKVSGQNHNEKNFDSLVNTPLSKRKYTDVTSIENNYSLSNNNFRYTKYVVGSEELYDHLSDPNEFNNLVNNQIYNATLQELRSLSQGETDTTHNNTQLDIIKEEYGIHYKSRFTTKDDYPGLKGINRAIRWKDTQINDNSYNFNTFFNLRDVKRALDDKLYFILNVGTQPFNTDMDWAFNQYNIPKIRGMNGSEPETYAHYFYQDNAGNYVYKNLVCRWLKKMLESVQPVLDGRLLCISLGPGPDDDPAPFNRYFVPNLADFSQPGINVSSAKEYNDKWFAFCREHLIPEMVRVVNEYNESHPQFQPVKMLFTEGFDELGTELTEDCWFKAPGIAQFYNMRNEPDLYNLIHTPAPSGKYYRTRGEMEDRSRYTWFEAAPKWNLNYQLMWALTFGLDVVNLTSRNSTTALGQVTDFHPYYDFFNKYAGKREAKNSNGAWIAFHDGIDYSDQVRFPDSNYGNSNVKNQARAEKILQEFENGGLTQFKPVVTDWSMVIPKGNNTEVKFPEYWDGKDIPDLFWKPWTDNYGMFIKQVDPLQTSYSLFRVGSAQNDAWGRFARGIGGAVQEKRQIFLDIDSDLPLVKNAKLRIVWYDLNTYNGQNQSGRNFTFRYKNNNTNEVITVTVPKLGDNKWKESFFDIENIALDNQLSGKADIVLNSNASSFAIFSLVEIIKSNATLPLKLVSFSGKLTLDKVKLNWITESEFNVSHFLIEKSIDGKSFETISKISAKNQLGKQFYEFFDADRNEGTVYYKLKSVDLDGTFSFSDVIAIKREETLISIYPNPVDNIVFINHLISEPGDFISIYTQDGKLIKKLNMESGSNKTQINCQDLKTGLYIMKINQVKTESIFKLIKK